MKNDYPWTWEDSACTDYLHPGWPLIDAMVARGKKPESVLVLGCGNGRSMNALALQNPDIEFIGVDMNAGYIERARDMAPVNTTYHCARFHQVMKLRLQVDLVLIIGVVGFLNRLNLVSLMAAAKRSLKKDGTIILNFPNKMRFAERMIYRDAIVPSGRNKEAALRVVQLIAAKHPSETVREYGEAILQNYDHDQEHFLFAPHFVPMYEWEMVKCAGKFNLALLHSCTSVWALEPDKPVNTITSEYRIHFYGRQPLHDHGH